MLQNFIECESHRELIRVGLQGKIVNDSDFQNKVIHATKWSTITEIAAKLVSPITNMILARILLPEAFGGISVPVKKSTSSTGSAEWGFLGLVSGKPVPCTLSTKSTVTVLNPFF